jgi:hypothetical protein
VYLLHDPAYPDREFSVQDVEKAWLSAGFKRLAIRAPRGVLGAHDVRGLINTQLLAVGATMAGSDSSNFEVPDESKGLLEALERFYLALYPEMAQARPPRNFFYERVEWLGQG